MTQHVGFLADLPVRAVLDGELVALDAYGKPDFPLICECLLQHPVLAGAEKWSTRRPVEDDVRASFVLHNSLRQPSVESRRLP
jgi:hypothetical protein